MKSILNKRINSKAYPGIFEYILSFEFFFVLFIFAGRFKGYAGISHINEAIDITLATCILSIIASGFVWLRHTPQIDRRTLNYLIIYIALLVLATSSYMVGSHGIDSTFKIKRFLVFTSWSLLAPIIACRNKESLTRLVTLILVFSTVAAADSIIRFVVEGGKWVGVFGLEEGYQGLGRLTGLGLSMILMPLIFGGRKSGWFLYLAISAILYAGIVVSVTRQAFVGIAVVGCFIVYCQLSLKGIESFRLRYIVILFCAIATLLGVWWGFEQTTKASWHLYRISTLFDPHTLAQSGRWEVWDAALQLSLEKPLLGAGFGDFRTSSGLGRVSHPHNLFLESFSELGVGGLLLISILVGVPLLLCRRVLRWSDPIGLSLASGFLFLFSCAMFSGDLASNRLMFTFSGVLLTYHAICERNIRKFYFK